MTDNNVISVDFKRREAPPVKTKPRQEDNDVWGTREMLRSAIQNIFREVIIRAIETGVPDDHALFITFDTRIEGVVLSRDLMEKWPTQMTIVLQHQYSNLHIDDDALVVTLSFNQIPQTVRIPFHAIEEMGDPKAPFCLRAV